MPTIKDSFNNNTNSPMTINLPKHEVPKVLTKQTHYMSGVEYLLLNIW